ncbi:sensor histidine kinase [Actinorugispora endophytica]|uniref:histidine kinase n=1 Tax=Actinorugispora endophytica TaxID=1605990 RepID=A0A4V3D9B7_9ACTN|nr:ATP-binding protein [Actinorugispora endophytica]TDQ55520.1 histidine kinase/DNA gyrase B/HSP90-like ATPase [Actinorugispora endophytica]
MGKPVDGERAHSPEGAPGLARGGRPRRERWWRWLTGRAAQAPPAPEPPARQARPESRPPQGDPEPQNRDDSEDLLPTALASLAMRDLTLVDSLLAFVERLERQEEDPEQLDVLFQIDHLATRMRRNGENLLILAGHGVEGKHREAVPLLDVVRAAMSEVSEYTRVRTRELPEDTAISPEAADDISHLIAELLDNAIANSSDSIPVTVRGRLAEDGALLMEVVDDGIGIPDDRLAQLNTWLATPPSLNEEVIRHMGLYVVSRLAARQGAGVRLQTRPFSGTTAHIRVPAEVIGPVPRPPRGPAAPVEPQAPGLPAPRRGPVPRSGSATSVGPTGLPRRDPERRRDVPVEPAPERDGPRRHGAPERADGELWELPRRRPVEEPRRSRGGRSAEEGEETAPARGRRPQRAAASAAGRSPGFAERIRADLDGFISGQTEAAERVARGGEGNERAAGPGKAVEK